MAVVVSATAVVVALVQGGRDRRAAEATAITDRRAAQELAHSERRAAARHARLLIELDAASTLAANLHRGGSTDPDESRRMGSEALRATALIGSRWIPERYSRVAGSDAELRSTMEQQGMPEWKREALEASLAVNAILRELDEEDV